MDLAICRQFIYAAFHSLEQRFERFRQGAAARVPDLTDFRHKVAEFLAKFSWNKPEPTITVTQPSRAPASLQPDPTLEGLEKPFFMRREEMFDEELVPEPTLDSVEITHEALDEGGHRIATDAKEAATNFVKTLKEAVAEAGEAATKFVEAAKDSLSNTIDGFMGSPPPPPPPPPPAAIVPTTISGEHREELAESIASQPDMHWVGQRKSEQTRHALEHPQPKIIDPEISPQREGTFFEPKEVREPLAEQKPAVEKMTNRPEESVTLSDADLKEAAKLVRDAALRAEADAYKEQEAMFATQNPVASSAGVAIEPAAEPDPTEAEAFRHWGSPGNPMSETERTAVRPPQARHKDETRRRERFGEGGQTAVGRSAERRAGTEGMGAKIFGRIQRQLQKTGSSSSSTAEQCSNCFRETENGRRHTLIRRLAEAASSSAFADQDRAQVTQNPEATGSGCSPRLCGQGAVQEGDQ